MFVRVGYQHRTLPCVIAPIVTAAALALATMAAAGDEQAGGTRTGNTTAGNETAAPAERDLTLRGGEDVTAFGSLTVVGEDRIHVEFDRPVLALDLDPESAPGLDWGTPADVLDRSVPDLNAPFLATSALASSPYIARPWLRHFSSGAVAVFRMAITDVERWTLSIADSRGEVVAVFSGQGSPPREIVWDGRTKQGAQVVPGRVYSSVFEAYDRAGNKRSLIGEGFQVGAYRFDTATGPIFLFPASELAAGGTTNAVVAAAATPPLLLEVATWINQSGRPTQPVRVVGVARSYEEGNALASRVGRALAPHVVGSAARIQTAVEVESDAPVGGTVRITNAPAGK